MMAEVEMVDGCAEENNSSVDFEHFIPLVTSTSRSTQSYQISQIDYRIDQ